MFTVLSKFKIKNSDGMTASVRQAFIDRPHMVDDVAGFVRLDALTPRADPDEIWLLTYWDDESSFKQWYKTHQYKDSHSKIPAGLKLESSGAELLFFEHITG